MTHKVTVRFGGAADSEVHDYSDRIRLLGDGSPLISGGMACDNGTAGMGQLILDDVDNDIPHRTEPPGLQLAAHNQLIWSEDSPGYESWLSIGRIDNKTVGRPYTYTAGVNRQWTVQWADANIDFDGLTLTEDWVRPAESDVDRVLAAVAAFCNGDPRLTTVFETHLVANTTSVSMPAKTYPAGTELPELFDDCASQAGKVYSVVIHDQDSASHTCLLHIDEEDHDTYACTLSISDQLDEVDGETVFEPVWRQGGATEEQGQELITGLVSRYGLDTSATVVVTDSDHADSYDYWVKPFNDDLAVTATEATNRATAMVHSRWTEHVTHQPSILIPARLHYLLKAGMSINIKSAAAMGGQYLNTVQTRRIANIEWSHAGWRGTDAMLWANLQLDRTPRKLPLSIGIKPGPTGPSGSCTDVTSSKAPHFIDGTSTDWGVGGAPRTGGGDGHGGSAFFGTSSGLDINCTVAYGFTGLFSAGKTYTLQYWYRSNFTNSMPFEFGATGDKTTGSLSLIGDTEWRFHEIEWTPSADVTGTGSGGPVAVRWGAPSGDTGQFDVSDGSLEECSDAEAPPASDDTTGDPGTGDSCFSPCDHKHPVPDHGNLTGLSDDDHTQYVKKATLTTKGDIYIATAAGTITRLAVGSDDQILTADSGETPGVKWAAAPSGFSNPMTTAGDIIKGGTSGAAARLGIGTSGQVLTVVSGAPAWADAGGGGGGGSGVLPLGMPYGTLERSYDFTSTVESWTTTAGTLSSTGGRLRLVGSGTALEPSGASNIADGEVVAWVDNVTGTANPDIAFRVTDSDNLYLLEIKYSGSPQGLNLYKKVSGSFTLVEGADITSSVNNLDTLAATSKQFKVMIRFVGSLIDVYINDSWAFSAVDSTFTTGRIGFVTDGTNEIDAIRVYSITTETQGSPGTGNRV